MPEVKNHKQIGMGGIFSVDTGKIKAHVMPQFKKTIMSE